MAEKGRTTEGVQPLCCPVEGLQPREGRTLPRITSKPELGLCGVQP